MSVTSYNTPADGAKFTSGDSVAFSITTTANGNISLYCDTAADPATVIHTWSKGNVNQETLTYSKVFSTTGTYYWDVHGSYVTNPPSPRSFTVYAVAPKTTTPTPTNNSTQRPLNQQLTFVRPSGAVKADVWLKAGSGAWNKIASVTTALTVNPGTLTGNTTYQWRVDTYNGADRLTTGDTWQFSTLTNPTKATNPSPANGSTQRPLGQVLSWTRPSSATSCDVWFGPSGNMTKVLSATTATTYDPPSLVHSTVYQWRIDTKNAAGTTTGDVWQFTTVTPPAAPTTPTPANGATDVARNQDISWNACARATSYRVYFSTSLAAVEQKQSSALQSPDVTTTSWDTGLLGVNVTYYWRIIAINEAGSVDGPVWNFITGTPVIADPVIRNYKKRLCALAANAANPNRFYYSNDNVPPTMSYVTLSALDTTKPCAMLEAFQKVYIVNNGNYFVVDFCNTALGGITWNYTTNYRPERGSILYQGSAAMVVDCVYTSTVYGFVTNGTFVTGQAVTGNDSSGRATSFTPTTVTNPGAAPLVYPWKPYPNRLSASGNEYGLMPIYASIIRMYRGRCVLAGDKNAPHQWYMSEQGNFYNWAYGSEDQKAPVAGTDTDIGKIGDIIRAVIPYSDDFCIFGCSQTSWLLRGDPAVSASLDNISYVIGIFSDTSWCFDDKSNLYILNPNGIYMLPQGIGVPVCLTENIIPNFGEDFAVDESIHQICMGYDRIRHGILITKTTDGSNQNYWLDLRNSGFFPEEYPAAVGATSLHYYDAMMASYRLLHVGCKDGYIRAFDDGQKADDIISGFAPIAAEMVIGPLPLSKTGSVEGLLVRLNITPADGTDQVLYQIFTAKTAEQVIKAVETAIPSARINGIVANLLKITRPRARGAYFAIRFYSDGQVSTWAVDNLSGEFIGLGMVK